MQQNVKEVAICESGLFPFPYTEGKTFKTNPSNLSWSEFGKGWEELMQRGGGGGGAWAFLLGKGWPYLNMSMNK